MKIGDIVVNTKIRPTEHAKVVKAEIKQIFNEKKKETETRTAYVAEYDDKTVFKFYGFDINRSVFKVVEDDGQITIYDILGGISNG